MKKKLSIKLIKNLTVHGLAAFKARLDCRQLARPGARRLKFQKIINFLEFHFWICEILTYGKATLTKVSLDFQLIAEPDESKSFQKKPKTENSGISTLLKAFLTIRQIMVKPLLKQVWISYKLLSLTSCLVKMKKFTSTNSIFVSTKTCKNKMPGQRH